MPSPFPGVDPYIESPALWSDFHNNLASEIQAHLYERGAYARCLFHTYTASPPLRARRAPPGGPDTSWMR